jgi:predicted ATPase
VSSFIGRADEVAAVSELIDAQRLVTLTGAGGCGKTRLALAVADATLDRHPGGTWWAGLGPLSSHAQVLELIARSTGHTPTSGADLTDELVVRLDMELPSLLVLDNAEHVLEPVDALITELLPRCPNLTVLATSREPLGRAGELVWRVPSLDTSDARELFLERARHARPALVLDDDAEAYVRAICAGLDGLPLALELAAARTRTLPLATVATGVGDAMRWQASGSRSTLAQHATLHASISWSVDLLDPIARTVLLRLSVFESAFTLESATAVAGAGHSDDELAASISTLVDASLVELDDATARYRMLRIVRQFCSLRAQGTADLDATRRRHVRQVADWCTEVGDGRRGIERGPLIVEMPDVVAAMQWARQEEPIEVLRMCAGLAAVRSALGFNANVLETWEWLMSLDRSGAEADGWSAEWAAAVAALMAPVTAQSIDVGTVVDEVRCLLPDDRHRERGWLARGAAMAPAYRGHVGPILAHAEEAARRGDEMEISIYGGFAAYMLSMMGRRDDLEVRLDELRRLTRRRHTTFSVDTVGNGYAGAVLGDLSQGDLRAAARRATDRVPDDPAFSMTAAAALAQVALHTGDRATMACAVAWSRQETIPMLRYLPILIDLTSAVTDGSTEAAADLAEDYWEESAHVPVSRCHPLPLLTSALLAAGRLDAATSCVEAADGLVHDMDPAPWLRAGVLHGRAQLALHRGDLDALALHADRLAEMAAAQSFATMAIDASELAAAAMRPSFDRDRLLAEADAARQRVGYRWRPLVHAPGGADAQV